MSSILSSTLQTAGIALGGLVASRTSMWLSQKVEDTTGISIGGLLSKITPNKVANLLKATAHSLNYPLTFIAEKIKDTYLMGPYERDEIKLSEFGRRSEKVERLFQVILAPVYEELAFRGVVQTLGGVALETAGAPPSLAHGLSMVIANTMFAQAHLASEEDLDSTTFSTMAVGGVTETVICHNYGLIASIASHALNNLSTEWVK